ncbi:hypothetical protein ACFV2Q_04260 [Streptomyces sp. NPDC059650]|uniref:hypothetical protein n=1 Tax=Streptomyces sp. NPDC059650 TaxID=3346896 RepID=UPI00369F74B0
MAGTLDLVERGVTGLEPGTDGLHIDPVPLSGIPGSAFSLAYLGHRDRLGVCVPPSLLGPVPLLLPGGRYEQVAAGRERWFRLHGGWDGRVRPLVWRRVRASYTLEAGCRKG